jgi:hypothetical protein
MYFGHKETLKQRAARGERPDLLLLCREMEMRHQQLLRAMAMSRKRVQPASSLGEY